MRILHFADSHLGTENHGRLDPTTGLNSRLLDFVATLSKLVDHALAERVDAVLFAGDAYRTHDPNPTVQREFARQINRLAQAGIPIALLVGNHDHPVSFGRASALEIFRTLQVPNVTVISRPGVYTLQTLSGPLQVAGIPWPHRSLLLAKDEYRQLNEEEITLRLEQILAELIESLAESLEPGVPAVLLAHLSVATAVYSGSERTAMIGREPVLLPGILANPAFDYVALGHIHRFQNLNSGGQPPVVYSGSLDRVDFGEEAEEKGFCLAETVPGGQTLVRQVALPVRPFITIRVNILPEEDPETKLLQEIARHSLQDAIVRLIYTIPEERVAGLDLARVREALQPAWVVTQISREVVASERKARVEVSGEQGVAEALDRYIKNHPELTPQGPVLKHYAAELDAEWWQGVKQG